MPEVLATAPPGAEGSALLLHRGTRAVQQMVEFAPSTGGLALWMGHQDQPADAPAVGSAGPAAPISTDGHTLRYAPAFATLPLPEQVGWVAHEVLHIALRHPQRYLALQQLLGDVDLALFNICADAIVNSTLGHLSWLQLPRDAVRLDTLLWNTLALAQQPEVALLEWDVERLYRAVDDRRPPDGGSASRRGQKAGQGGGQGAGQPGRPAGTGSGGRPAAAARSAGGGADPAATAQGAGGAARDETDGATGPAPRPDGPRAARARALGAAMAPDLRPDPLGAGAPEDEAEQAREWSERIARAHAGDGDFSMLRALIADLPRTRTPWEQLLRTQLARALSPRPEVSWSRPSRSYLANQGRAGPHRRMPWEPGHAATQAVARLVVIVDVSGSIDGALMERFAREIEAITRRLEAGLTLVVGDDRVQRVLHCAPGRSELRDIEFTGGGGTDFTPLLQEAEQHAPDIVVVLTDLQGPARHQPRCPVLWAVPEAWAHARLPFGRLLVLR